MTGLFLSEKLRDYLVFDVPEKYIAFNITSKIKNEPAPKSQKNSFRSGLKVIDENGLAEYRKGFNDKGGSAFQHRPGR